MNGLIKYPMTNKAKPPMKRGSVNQWIVYWVESVNTYLPFRNAFIRLKVIAMIITETGITSIAAQAEGINERAVNVMRFPITPEISAARANDFAPIKKTYRKTIAARVTPL